MTEREPSRSGERQAGGAPPLPPPVKILSEHTMPVPPMPAILEGEPVILGFPAEFATGAGVPPLAEPAPVTSRPPDDVSSDAGAQQHAARESPLHLVVVRRSEPFGGVALVLAGVAAGVSLGFPWWRGTGASGQLLVREGVTALGSGVGALGRSGQWQPVAVVLGGGVLLLLGLLLFRRARTHRVVGVVALLTAWAVASGVVVPLADANWSAASFGPGMWCAVAVAVLGVLGALKAVLTVPVVTLQPR